MASPIASADPAPSSVHSQERAGSPSPSLSHASSTTPADYTLAADLNKLAWIVHYTGLPSVLGFIHEGRFYASAINTQVARGTDGATVDGAVYGGDKNLRALSFAERLAYLRAAPQSELRQVLELQDGKAAHPYVFLDHGVTAIELSCHFSHEQIENCSLAHVAPAARPGLVAMLPIGNPERWTGIVDPVFKYRGLLMPTMPVPGLLSPFTIRLDQVEEFYNRFVEHLHTNEPFRMPGTNVLIKQWPFKLHETRKDNLLSDAGGADRAAERGFTRLYDAISRSDSARRDRLDLEFAPYQPLQGDGILRRKGGETTSSGKPPSHDAEPRPTVPKEWIIEVKEELIREIDDGTVGITMLGARYASKISKPNQAESREGNFQEAEEEGERETRSLSRDMFNPFRTWDFACLFNLAGDSVYLIPCSEIQKEWWTGTIELVIDAAVLKPFRVSLEDELWFDEAYERIILRHPNPKRSASIIPASPNWETAASAYADRTHAPELRYRGQNQPIEAWAKIDRANEECARQGFGVWLRVGHKAKIAEYIFAPFVWSDDDKAIFHANPGTLPVALTAADLSIHMPVLLLRTMMGSRHYNETPAWPTWIHTKDLLERGPFPRLNLVVHIGRSTQRYLHSSLLIPDEFIDVGTILASLSARAGKPVSSYAHLREVLRQAGQTGDYNLRLDMSTLIKKPAHLHEFQVREGWDFHNASQQFMMAHVHPEKLLSWYKPEALHAGLQYCQTFDVVLQELADNFFATGEVDDEEDMDEDLDQPPGDAIRAELAGAGQLDGPVDVAVSVGGQTDGPADAGSDPSDGSDEEDEIDGRRLDWRDLVDVDNPPDYQSDDEYEWTDEDDGWSTEDGEELEEESGEESDGSGEGEDKKPAASEPVQDEDAGSGAEQEVLQTDAKVVER